MLFSKRRKNQPENKVTDLPPYPLDEVKKLDTIRAILLPVSEPPV